MFKEQRNEEKKTTQRLLSKEYTITRTMISGHRLYMASVKTRRIIFSAKLTT